MALGGCSGGIEWCWVGLVVLGRSSGDIEWCWVGLVGALSDVGWV